MIIDNILQRYLISKGMYKEACDPAYVKNLKNYIKKEEAFYVKKDNK